MKFSSNWIGLGLGSLLVALAPSCVINPSDDASEDAATADDSDDDMASDDDDSDASTADDDDTASDDDDSDDDAASDDDDSDAGTGTGIVVIRDGDDAGAEGDGGTEPVVVGSRGNCGVDTSSATEVSGAITEDTTWSGTVILSGSVQVRAVELTIEPGTNIVMGPDASLFVGWNSTQAVVKAVGTADEPIIFCGEEATPGFWGEVAFESGVRSNSKFQHVNMFDGGGDGAEATLDLGAEILVEHLLVSGSESAGVRAVAFNDDSSMLSVVDSAQAVLLDGESAVSNFPLGGAFTGNEEQLARIVFNVAATDVVFHDLGIPYLQETDLQVRANSTATFEPGVEYRFAADTTLEVGWNSTNAEILVNGTEASPVVFRGEGEEPAYWGGVNIESGVLTSSKLSYLEIWHAGASDSYALDIDAAIELDNVSLFDNGNGVFISDVGVDSDSVNLSATGTEGYPLTTHPNALVTLPTGGDLTGNDEDRIRVMPGALERSGTIQKHSVPYRLEGSFQTREPSAIIIEAGTEFRMGPDAEVRFGWNSGDVSVTAVGTEEAPIRFVGANSTPGYWKGVVFEPKVLSDSSLRWVEVSDSGEDDEYGAFYLQTSVDIEQCTFSGYRGTAISKLDTDTRDYAADNTFDGAAVVTR